MKKGGGGGYLDPYPVYKQKKDMFFFPPSLSFFLSNKKETEKEVYKLSLRYMIFSKSSVEPFVTIVDVRAPIIDLSLHFQLQTFHQVFNYCIFIINLTT